MGVSPLVGKTTVVQAGIESVEGTLVPATVKLEVLSETLSTKATKSEDHGIRGSLQRFEDNSQVTRKDHSGEIVMLCRFGDIDFLSTFIFGGADGAYAQEAKTATLEIQRGTTVYIFAGVKVDEWSMEMTSGEAIKITMSVVAYTRTTGSLTAALSYETDVPMTTDGSTLSIGGTVREFHSLTFGIRRGIDQDHFVNSVERTSAVSTEYTPFGTTELDYAEATKDIIALCEADAAVAIVVGVTDGSNPITFTMAQSAITGDQPTTADMGVLKYAVEWTAMQSGTDDALAVVGLS